MGERRFEKQWGKHKPDNLVFSVYIDPSKSKHSFHDEFLRSQANDLPRSTMLQLLLFCKNPILHLSLSLSSYLSSKFLFFFLHGVHSYIHPDSLPQNNGLRAALRRPGSSGTGSVLEGYQSLSSKTSSELRKRNKYKEKADFDEKGAQIFRLKLDQGHLQSRLFIDQELLHAICVPFL